jgi:hypothetical protein
MSNFEEDVYTELCAGSSRRGMEWWRKGVWKLKKEVRSKN